MEAESRKDALVKYGLSLPVLEEFGQLLDRFDAAIALGNQGRTAHKEPARAQVECGELRGEVSRRIAVFQDRGEVPPFSFGPVAEGARQLEIAAHGAHALGERLHAAANDRALQLLHHLLPVGNRV